MVDRREFIYSVGSAALAAAVSPEVSALGRMALPRRAIPAETLPIILCTSIYRSRIYREEALAAGAQRYLLRPIHPNDLLREASTLIQECQAV